jgi:aspartyl-tRNA(Asn)/glutamyl-tRNA(Gln) amidotransferase subunit A
MEFHQLTLKELQMGLREKKFSSVELTNHFIKRVRNSDLNAFITITDDLAIEQAKKADSLIATGHLKDLTGIPYAHKDIFCTLGVKTSAGSKILDPFISPYDATVSEKLNDSNAVMLGKANMDELAMGSGNENSFYGPVKNPWNHSKIPGGSSGGSAAAVAAKISPFSTGTDTGGSIRQPASLCGITGLKPTYGRVSRYGMIAYASSLDQAGPMTQTAEDAAIVLKTIAGFDKKDSTSADKAVPDYEKSLNNSLIGLKIGIPQEYFSEGLEDGVKQNVLDAIKEFEALGATVKEVSLPHSKFAIPAYYIIAPCECSSNLSRLDGVRYGYRCESPKDLSDLYIRSRSEGFGEEVKRRIMIGSFALSAGYYDAYYLKALKSRRLISNDFQEAFKEVDVIMGPVSPTTAWDIGSKKDPVSNYLSDIYTLSVNLAGLPAMSIPAGLSNNMPVGLHIIGNYWTEERLLNIAHQFQNQTDWHKKSPKGVD